MFFVIMSLLLMVGASAGAYSHYDTKEQEAESNAKTDSDNAKQHKTDAFKYQARKSKAAIAAIIATFTLVGAVGTALLQTSPKSAEENLPAELVAEEFGTEESAWDEQAQLQMVKEELNKKQALDKKLSEVETKIVQAQKILEALTVNREYKLLLDHDVLNSIYGTLTINNPAVTMEVDVLLKEVVMVEPDPDELKLEVLNNTFKNVFLRKPDTTKEEVEKVLSKYLAPKLLVPVVTSLTVKKQVI